MTWGVFLFFAGFVIMMTTFVALCVPETKGVHVEDVDALIVTKHWFWSRMVKGTVGADTSCQEDALSKQALPASLASGKATRLSVVVEVQQDKL
jgi:hypothetical protein